MRDYERAAEAFPLGEVSGFSEIRSGHINATYRADAASGEKYILQKINGYVFRDADGVMENIMGVTEHIRTRMSPGQKVMEFLRTRDGANYFRDPDGSAWRCYRYIGGVEAYDKIESPDLYREAGRAFGEFQALLSDYPAETLKETIPAFHDTENRIRNLEIAMEKNASGRLGNCLPEAEAFLARREKLSSLARMMKQGLLPVRVTHNDTKINNVLFDRESGRAAAVIDLDTVMPGSILYDFGDAIRSGSNTAAEDEPDASKVGLDLTLFAAFSEGFLPEVSGTLTDAEVKHLPLSAIVMTAEVGIRFLTDYIDGDVYFRTEYPEHNLVRARSQLALALDMEKKEEEMTRIVEEILM